jgi:amino acid transporter
VNAAEAGAVVEKAELGANAVREPRRRPVVVAMIVVMMGVGVVMVVVVVVVVMVVTMDVLPGAVGAFRGRLSAPAYRTHQTTSSS